MACDSETLKEVRNEQVSNLWPTLMENGNPDSRNPYGMISGIGWARTSSWFTFPD